MQTAAAAVERPNYLNISHTAQSWLLTRDHKRIGLLYLAGITFFFAIGGLFALGIRLELLTPGGDVFESETYNKVFTLHGVMMVFFFLIPSIPATLGNFLVPMMIGAKDLAFPRINLLSWYIYMVGGLFTLCAVLLGGVDTGWTFYTPYSTADSNTDVFLTGLGVFISGFSSILTGLNFIVTIHTMRAPGMTWDRMPLFIWAHYATALIMILGTPVVAIAVLLVALERTLHVGIFDPTLGGDPVLYQHLFWYLLAPGRLHHGAARHGRHQRTHRRVHAQGDLRLQVRGLLEPRHRADRVLRVGPPHVRQQPVGVRRDGVLVPHLPGGDPFGDQGVQLDGHPLQGLHQLRVADDVRASASSGCSLVGGLTGLFLGAMGLDVHVHDTYFVVAHFHYVMVGGTIMAYLGGLHYWWPKITGRLYPEGWAKFAALVVFVGFNLTFFPAVHPRLPGHAAPLPLLSRGVPGAERRCRPRARPSSGSVTGSRSSTSSGRCSAVRRRRRTRGAPRGSNGRRHRRRPLRELHDDVRGGRPQEALSPTPRRQHLA